MFQITHDFGNSTIDLVGAATDLQFQSPSDLELVFGLSLLEIVTLTGAPTTPAILKIYRNSVNAANEIAALSIPLNAVAMGGAGQSTFHFFGTGARDGSGNVIAAETYELPDGSKSHRDKFKINAPIFKGPTPKDAAGNIVRQFPGPLYSGVTPPVVTVLNADKGDTIIVSRTQAASGGSVAATARVKLLLRMRGAVS